MQTTATVSHDSVGNKAMHAKLHLKDTALTSTLIEKSHGVDRFIQLIDIKSDHY